jgi:hypothetical protein
LSSWIFVAEKQWIHWGTNVLPAILKDDHMYLFLLNISVKRTYSLKSVVDGRTKKGGANGVAVKVLKMNPQVVGKQLKRVYSEAMRKAVLMPKFRKSTRGDRMRPKYYYTNEDSYQAVSKKLRLDNLTSEEPRAPDEESLIYTKIDLAVRRIKRKREETLSMTDYHRLDSLRRYFDESSYSDDSPDWVDSDDSPDWVDSDDSPDWVDSDDSPDSMDSDDSPDSMDSDDSPDSMDSDDSPDSMREMSFRKEESLGTGLTSSSSDESLPSLEESLESNGSADSIKEILRKGKNEPESPSGGRANPMRYKISEKPMEATKAARKEISYRRFCFRSCAPVNMFFLILSSISWRFGKMVYISGIIYAWFMSHQRVYRFMNPKHVIELFTNDVKILQDHMHLFKESIKNVVLYRNMIIDQLKDSKGQANQKFSDLRKSLHYLAEISNGRYNAVTGQVGYKLGLILKDFQEISSSFQPQLEALLEKLILYGGRVASFPPKLLNELNFVIDLSNRISNYTFQKASQVHGIMKVESLATADYLWRQLMYKIRDGEISVRSYFKMLAYDLGNAVVDGAENQIRRTAQSSLNSISNAETILYTTAFESAERVGAGIYYGLKRELLSNIFQIIFYLIPTYIVGAFIYNFAEGYVAIE